MDALSFIGECILFTALGFIGGYCLAAVVDALIN